jgi:hypothetical protein
MLIAFQTGHLAFPGKAPELVYTTLEAGVLAAETHNGRFTEQSSDVTERQHGRRPAAFSDNRAVPADP